MTVYVSKDTFNRIRKNTVDYAIALVVAGAVIAYVYKIRYRPRFKPDENAEDNKQDDDTPLDPTRHKRPLG